MIDTMHTDHKLSHVVGMSMLRQGTRLPRPIYDLDTGRLVRPEVLVERAPSNRAARRQRARDSYANGKKSRRTAFKQRTEARNVEQNLRGMARVYFGQTVVSPAMFENVTRHVQEIARNLAKRDGEELEVTMKRVEGELLNVLVAFGEDPYAADEAEAFAAAELEDAV